MVVCLGRLGASAQQILPHYFGTEGTANPWPLLLGLGGVFVLCNLVGVGGFLWKVRGPSLEPSLAHLLFTFLGVASFALAVSLGFLIFWDGQHGPVLAARLERVAVLVALAGLPVLAIGLVVHRGLESSREAGVLRVAGTAVALLGALVMLGALGLAWPEPIPLIAIAVVNFLVFCAMAFRFDLPILQTAAIASLTIGLATAWHLARGKIEFERLANSMRELALSTDTGIAFGGIFFLVALGGEIIARFRRTAHARLFALAQVSLPFSELVW